MPVVGRRPVTTTDNDSPADHSPQQQVEDEATDTTELSAEEFVTAVHTLGELFPEVMEEPHQLSDPHAFTFMLPSSCFFTTTPKDSTTWLFDNCSQIHATPHMEDFVTPPRKLPQAITVKGAGESQATHVGDVHIFLQLAGPDSGYSRNSTARKAARTPTFTFAPKPLVRNGREPS